MAACRLFVYELYRVEQPDHLLVPADKDLVRYMDTTGNITREDLLDIVNGEDAMPITVHGWLHSITRESDNDKIVQRIERGMPYYETTLRERVGKNLNGNLIIRGECLSACAYLKDKGEKVDLVYIDPPFTRGPIW